MVKAYSYLRFSTPEQMRGDSFRRQTALAQEYAAQQGLELDQELTFHDLGVSAYRGKNAEAGKLGDFLEAVRSGLVEPDSVLLVEGLDRISRLKPRKALRVLEAIVDEGVAVVTLNDRRRYDAESLDEDPMSLLMAILTFIRANEESATKGTRLREVWKGKRQKAQERPVTAKAPAWLRLKEDRSGFESIPDRAQVVQRIFTLTLDGMGAHSIERLLNKEGTPVFGTGKQWSRSYVLKILENPAVVGTFIPHVVEWEGGRKVRKPLEPVLGYFPAVVEAEDFQRVQALRKGASSKRGRHAATAISNVLGGLAKCPMCGATMTLATKNKSKGWVYLVCTAAKAKAGCTYRSVRYHAVEEAVVERLVEVLEQAPPPDNDAAILSNLEAVEGALFELQERAYGLADELAANPSPIIRNRLKTVEADIATAQTEREELRGMIAQARGPLVERRIERAKEAVATEPLDRGKLNAALRELFGKVVVDYEWGNLRFHWHHGQEAAEAVFAWPEEMNGTAP